VLASGVAAAARATPAGEFMSAAALVAGDSLAPAAPHASTAPDSGAAPDSTAADSSRVIEIGAGAKSATSGPPVVKRFDQPRWVMLRSLVVPGWGQLHNHAWIKAAIIAGLDLSTRVKIVNDEHVLSRLRVEADEAAFVASLPAATPEEEQRYTDLANAYNDRLATSVNRRWTWAGILVYAMLDAYVDAHFVHFDTDFHSDPALPGGAPSPGSARLYLRWNF
jgi:hypothetical protein